MEIYISPYSSPTACQEYHEGILKFQEIEKLLWTYEMPLWNPDPVVVYYFNVSLIYLLASINTKVKFSEN